MGGDEEAWLCIIFFILKCPSPGTEEASRYTRALATLEWKKWLSLGSNPKKIFLRIQKGARHRPCPLVKNDTRSTLCMYTRVCVCACVCVAVASQMSWSRGPGSRLAPLLKSMTSAKPLNLCQMGPRYLSNSAHRVIARIGQDNGCGNTVRGRKARAANARDDELRQDVPLTAHGLANLSHLTASVPSTAVRMPTQLGCVKMTCAAQSCGKCRSKPCLRSFLLHFQ